LFIFRGVQASEARSPIYDFQAIEDGTGGVGVGVHEGFGTAKSGVERLFTAPPEGGVAGIAAGADTHGQQYGHERKDVVPTLHRQ